MLSFAMLVAFALAPLALGLLLRHRALRPGATADQVWFPFTQRMQWLSLLNLGVWPTVFPPLAAQELARALGPAHASWLHAATFGGMALQIVAVQVLVAACLQDVNRRLRGADAAAPGTVLSGVWSLARIAIGLVGLVGGVTALVRGELHTALGAVLGGVAGMLALGRFARTPRNGSPNAVTSGDLRDHVFALASRAGVTLNQLYVMPTARNRVANALAVQNHTVMITDYLLPHLTRDQLLAVMAHELAHLQRRHPAWLGIVLFGGMIVTWPLAQMIGAPVMLSFGVTLFGFLALSRRFEYAADAGALALGARPEALISGLAVVGRLNHVPQRWSRLREWTLTHPSNERRARAIAARAGLDPARIPELLATPGAPGADTFALPPGAGEGRVFNSAFKAAALSRNVWTLLLSNVAASVALAVAGTMLGLHGWARALAFLPLGAVVFGLTLWVVQHIAMHPYRRLRKPLCAQLERMGFDPRGRATEMVGLAPGDRARYYEGFASWDVGFLWFRPDRLVYLGEETSFSLTRGEIVSLEPGPAFPGWVRSRGVCLRWSRKDRSGVFTLQAARAGGLLALAGEVRRLAARIELWRAEAPGSVRLTGVHTGLPPVPVPIGPPPTGEVTGVDPEAMIKPGAVTFTVILHVVLVGILAAVAGLGLAPPRGLGALDAMLASAIGYVLLVLPMLRTRRERRPDERGERRAA